MCIEYASVHLSADYEKIMCLFQSCGLVVLLKKGFKIS